MVMVVQKLAPLKLVMPVTSLLMILLMIAMKSAVMVLTTESSNAMMETPTTGMVAHQVAKFLTVGIATVVPRPILTLAMNTVVMVETTIPSLVLTLVMMATMWAMMVAPLAASLNQDTNVKVVTMKMLISAMKFVVMVLESLPTSTVMMVT
jgi:hypothetical protein